MDLYKESLINKIEDDLAGRNQNWAAIEEEVIRIDGDIQNIRETGYRYVDTLYLTEDTTFEKANYPWLRAVRVKCQGGGGAGGGTAATISEQSACGNGGSGGDYAEALLDLSALPASVNVTIGAGGKGVVDTVGGNGGTSSFGNLVVAPGGIGGTRQPSSATIWQWDETPPSSTAPTGDFFIKGCPGEGARRIAADRPMNGAGGASHLGAGGGHISMGGSTGINGRLYGGGGSGSVGRGAGGPAAKGGDGAPGIVIIELYA